MYMRRSAAGGSGCSEMRVRARRGKIEIHRRKAAEEEERAAACNTYSVRWLR